VTQIGNGNIACVQTAVQQNIVSQGNGNAQANVAGDNIIANTNINAQAISQECNIEVEQVNEVAKKFLTVNEAGDVVVVKKEVATATASATASASASASASAAAPVQYQYNSATAAPEEETELPDTGGTSLVAIGAMVLLLGGGLTALLAVRRGTSG
jgi:hypothetical protein